MWNPFQPRDLTALLAGAVVAASAGLLLGNTLHPDLGTEHPMAPQTLMSGGGERMGDGGADPGLGRYPGPIPEYVTGTDSNRLVADFAGSAPTEPTDQPAYKEVPRATASPAIWRDRSDAPVAYPSDSGGVIYETDLPPPPPPPADDDPG